MKFIDEAIVEVHAGKGGDGIASFRREKFMPFGGPDGGDGGRGGSIHAIADRNINTLIDYRFARIHRAKNGEKGRGADCYGRGAADIELRMPVGTVVTDTETGATIADLVGVQLTGATGKERGRPAACSRCNQERDRGRSGTAAPAAREHDGIQGGERHLARPRVPGVRRADTPGRIVSRRRSRANKTG